MPSYGLREALISTMLQIPSHTGFYFITVLISVGLENQHSYKYL